MEQGARIVREKMTFDQFYLVYPLDPTGLGFGLLFIQLMMNGETPMIISAQTFLVNGIHYTIRSAAEEDAPALSALRVQIDGETENMDRESGEAYLDPESFARIIQTDAERPRNLFLVAAVAGRIIGFSRCEGTDLKRSAHKVEFGVCILKEFWGYGIGRNLLDISIAWADANGIKKMTLNVLETNETAIRLYNSFGFEVEGILKNDKLLSDGQFYHTVVMGRWKD